MTLCFGFALVAVVLVISISIPITMSSNLQPGYSASFRTSSSKVLGGAARCIATGATNNGWQRYQAYITRLQQRDNSTCKILKIWQIHNPLRHRLRDVYYRLVHVQSDLEESAFPHSRSGCVNEFANCLVHVPLFCLPHQCDQCRLAFAVCICGCLPFQAAGCTVGYSVSLCCCACNCLYGTYCTDFCLCETPMTSVYHF